MSRTEPILSPSAISLNISAPPVKAYPFGVSPYPTVGFPPGGGRQYNNMRDIATAYPAKQLPPGVTPYNTPGAIANLYLNNPNPGGIDYANAQNRDFRVVSNGSPVGSPNFALSDNRDFNKISSFNGSSGPPGPDFALLTTNPF